MVMRKIMECISIPSNLFIYSTFHNACEIFSKPSYEFKTENWYISQNKFHILATVEDYVLGN